MNQLINKSSKLSSKTKRRIRRSLQRQFPNNKCPYCEINIAFTIDHIIPKCLGGKNTLDNLILCCLNCNSKKGMLESKLKGKLECYK